MDRMPRPAYRATPASKVVADLTVVVSVFLVEDPPPVPPVVVVVQVALTVRVSLLPLTSFHLWSGLSGSTSGGSVAGSE